MNHSIHLHNTPLQRCRPGFAIIVTVSILVLLAVVAVGLLTLSTVSVRATSSNSATAAARANAKLSLMIALGELQKFAGPDQRVTSTGSMLDENASQANWMGVWSTEKSDTLPAWLVSGNDAEDVGDLDELSTHPEGYHLPESESGGDSFVLLSPRVQGAGSNHEVEVPTVDVDTNSGLKGRYAWWISDEGTKARVDIEAPETDPKNNYERLVRARAQKEGDFAQLDPAFEELSGVDAAVDKRTMLSFESLDLALGSNQVAPKYEHDLTIGGYGLPVNVVDGGTKTDLSVLFDGAQFSKRPMLEKHLGAAPTRLTKNGAKLFDFASVSDPEKFYLSSELRENGNKPVGPNWGNLYNYANLWQNVKSEESPVVAWNPTMHGDLRTTEWAPYDAFDRGDFRNDKQHTNSGIGPVLTVMQMGFRLSAEPATIPPENPGDAPKPGFQLQLQMKPLIGVWNPYNVKLKDTKYSAAWALYPYLHIGVNASDGKRYRPGIWMRENWLHGSGVGNENEFGTWFSFETETVDLEPGEIRLFSVDRRVDMSRTNKLVSTWNEEGAFTFDLKFSSIDAEQRGHQAGQKMIFPPGSVTWFGTCYIEDTQHSRTNEYFGDQLTDGVSASWITFNGGGGPLHRVSDLWQTPAEAERKRLKYLVPEQIISEWARSGGANTADQLPMELIAHTPYHVGTWRMYSRTATEAMEAQRGTGTQKIRGWVDSNPRFGPTNPVWDGSGAGSVGRSVKYEGFHFISPFIGGSYLESYDGGPPGRGKVAEGQNEAATFPEATLSDGRYRGFGGLTTSSSGQSHVTLFDVPRAPLVSLGQFQHAQLARYGYEPTYPFGNSYASTRIPLGQTSVQDFNDVEDFMMLDLSHAVNERIWDGFFFSTIGRDYYGPSRGGNLDRLFPVEDLLSGEQTLPNPRYRFVSNGSDKTVNEIVGRSDLDGPKALSSHIAVDGAFNVNSTSKAAWKAVLASMADFEFPVIATDGSNASWEDEGGIRFPRFGHVLQAEGWTPDSDPTHPALWHGYREISAEELDELAEEIVKEVRERGPFRSFADFVNRDPESDEQAHQRKGALQSALDRTLNADLEGLVGEVVEKPQGELFQDVISDETEAAGFSGYLMQGDLLQSLAPILQVRSDYFRIRASGQALDANGQVLATAVCEAYVQRVADYVDSEDEPHLPEDLLQANVNQAFGRRFKVVSFRWLSPEQI